MWIDPMPTLAAKVRKVFGIGLSDSSDSELSTPPSPSNFLFLNTQNFPEFTQRIADLPDPAQVSLETRMVKGVPQTIGRPNDPVKSLLAVDERLNLGGLKKGPDVWVRIQGPLTDVGSGSSIQGPLTDVGSGSSLVRVDARGKQRVESGASFFPTYSGSVGPNKEPIKTVVSKFQEIKVSPPSRIRMITLENE